jgi:hypothetical protein
MATARMVCHRCRHKWKVGRSIGNDECPKCGHTLVGPTDPAGGMLPKLIVVAAIALAGAWFSGLLTSEDLEQARDAVESTVDEVRDEVEDLVPETREDPPSAEEAPRKPAKKPARKPAKTPAPPEEEKEETKLPLAKVVVAGKSGAPFGRTYLVKGKVHNQGGGDAKDVRVTVIFKGDGGVLAKVEAKAPSRLAAGEKAPYEAAIAGDDAGKVTSVDAEVVYATDLIGD